MARTYLRMGAVGLKLFTGAFMGDKPVVNMDPAIAKAAVDVAHTQGKPVFAHPQNKVGVDTVIAAGVDVLAHPAPGPSGYTPEQLAQAFGEVELPFLERTVCREAESVDCQVIDVEEDSLRSPEAIFEFQEQSS